MPEEAAYRLTKVVRRYADGDGHRTALAGVSFEIPQGQFCAVEGPSGSGKSTLLSILGALDRDFDGSVKLLGNELRGASEGTCARLRNEKLGFVFQRFHLLPHLSVLQNVMAPGLFRSGGDFQGAAEAALEKVGLLDRAKDPPTRLSGGQQQRVALARAMVLKPAILLCDEPTGNLDRRTGGEVIELLASICAEGTTLVVVTHDGALAERAHRRLMLEDGSIVSEDGVPRKNSPDPGAEEEAPEDKASENEPRSEKAE